MEFVFKIRVPAALARAKYSGPVSGLAVAPSKHIICSMPLALSATLSGDGPAAGRPAYDFTCDGGADL
jgi:hypothetical protein